MDIATALIGIFGGAGAVLIWEAIVRPFRVRRDFAEAVTAELSLNSSIIGSAVVYRSHDRIDTGFRVSTKLYDLHSANLVTLPAGLATRIVNLYFLIEDLNRYPARFEQYVDDLRAAEDPELRKQISTEIEGQVARFNHRAEVVFERIGPIQDELYSLAFPWWSFRRFKRPKLKVETLEEIAKRVETGRARRLTTHDALRHVRSEDPQD